MAGGGVGRLGGGEVGRLSGSQFAGRSHAQGAHRRRRPLCLRAPNVGRPFQQAAPRQAEACFRQCALWHLRSLWFLACPRQRSFADLPGERRSQEAAVASSTRRWRDEAFGSGGETAGRGRDESRDAGSQEVEIGRGRSAAFGAASGNAGHRPKNDVDRYLLTRSGGLLTPHVFWNRKINTK